MAERPIPVFRTFESVILVGIMAIYDAQAEASERIPQSGAIFGYVIRRSAIAATSAARRRAQGTGGSTTSRALHRKTGMARSMVSP